MRISPQTMSRMKTAYSKHRPKPVTPEQQHAAAIQVIDEHNHGDRYGLTGYGQSHRLQAVIRDVIGGGR